MWDALRAPASAWLGLESANTALTIIEYRPGLPPRTRDVQRHDPPAVRPPLERISRHTCVRDAHPLHAQRHDPPRLLDHACEPGPGSSRRRGVASPWTQTATCGEVVARVSGTSAASSSPTSARLRLPLHVRVASSQLGHQHLGEPFLVVHGRQRQRSAPRGTGGLVVLVAQQSFREVRPCGPVADLRQCVQRLSACLRHRRLQFDHEERHDHFSGMSGRGPREHVADEEVGLRAAAVRRAPARPPGPAASRRPSRPATAALRRPRRASCRRCTGTAVVPGAFAVSFLSVESDHLLRPSEGPLTM